MITAFVDQADYYGLPQAAPNLSFAPLQSSCAQFVAPAH